MVKAKSKKPTKAVASKKKPSPAKTAAKRKDELSDDELERVSGGMVAPGVTIGVSQTEKPVNISNEKWIDSHNSGWFGGPMRGGGQ